MVSCYVLINTKNTYRHTVVDKLSTIKEISEINPLINDESLVADPFFEDYNLITKIKANNLRDLKKIVYDNISSIQGIIKTRIVSHDVINEKSNM